MENKIREIRVKLRLAMNGVTSSIMRKQGLIYKLNFGVSVPTLVQISSCYTPSVELAEALWKEDVREFKILATLLYPAEKMTEENALIWIRQIKYQEIADQLVNNLLVCTNFSIKVCTKWIKSSEEFISVIGFLLIARLCTIQKDITEIENDIFLEESCKVLQSGISRKQRAVILALKRYGRMNKENAKQVFSVLSSFAASDRLDWKEFYNDIRFEIEYYE